MTAYCPECGIEITPGDVFCGNCGFSLTPQMPKDNKTAQEILPQPANQSVSPFADSKQESANENSPAISAAEPEFETANNSLNISADKSEKLTVDNPQPFSRNENNSDTEVSETGEYRNESVVDKSIPEKKTAENWAMNTESVELPPLSDTQKSDSQNAALSNSGLDSALETEMPPADTQVENSKELPVEVHKQSDPLDAGSTEVSENVAESIENPAFNFDFKSEDKKTAVVESEQNESKQNNLSVESADDSVNEKPDDLSEPDFQSTIPYTPKDFAAQNSIASQIKDEKKSEENPSEIESSSGVEQFAAIEQPSVPVGSSMHDSLEPKSISVQIYDPKEKAHDAEPATLIKSSKGIMVGAKQDESSKEVNPLTSPNISGTETDGKSKAKLKPLDEGTLLNNRYEIVRKIGGGGMGAVYLASDRNLGGISRAVKEMVQSYIEDSQQEKAVNDFRRESMLLTSLEHPSIPTIFDYFFDEKEARFYLVMKYISGGDLAARLRAASEGRIDETSVTDWSIQIADVLDYLHNRQPPIVYRDLKPSNIMIDGNTSKVMLIDFGIARWVNKEEKGVTAVGTMGYAPPELFSGNVEPRSDIYSLGSTMFHLLTGADPQSNPLLIFDFHKNPRPRQINPQLTDQMEQILMKTVEYSADKRFANAAELRDALVTHLDNLKRGNVTIGAADSAKASSPSANQLVFCGFCGQKILASDVFCPFCGAQQAVSGQSASVSLKATAKLMIIGTNELDSPVFNLEKDTNLVGRRDPMSNIFPEVDLSKFDPQTKISRRHARIWRENDSFMVEDLGSSNGTILLSPVSEPQKLGKNQPRVLANGDKIRVGDTTLHFVLG